MMYLRSLAALAPCLLLFASSCNTRPASSSHLETVYEAYIPANATFLAGADVEKIRGTHIFQRVIGAAAGPELSSFTTQTGLDPQKDLSSIVTWSDGQRTVLLARGKYDEATVTKHLESHGMKRTSHKGANLFSDGSNSVIFLDGGLIAAGRTAAIESMLDSYDPARRLPIALAEQLQSVPANSEVWAVFTGGFNRLPALSQGGNLSNFLNVLDGVTGGSLGLDLSQGLDVAAYIPCRTNDDAKKVHDAARGLIGIGRLGTGSKQPDLLKVFDAIQVNQSDSTVSISAKLPQDLADKFLDAWVKAKS